MICVSWSLKNLFVREKSGNFTFADEWGPCNQEKQNANLDELENCSCYGAEIEYYI